MFLNIIYLIYYPVNIKTISFQYGIKYNINFSIESTFQANVYNFISYLSCIDNILIKFCYIVWSNIDYQISVFTLELGVIQNN